MKEKIVLANRRAKGVEILERKNSVKLTEVTAFPNGFKTWMGMREAGAS